jgi:8-oxo-dGTP pyrophosphatase MutT (NUDIX family)
MSAATRVRRGLLKAAYWAYSLRWRLLRPVTLGVRVMLVQDDSILLIRHSYQEDWYFPGGGVKRGESLLEAAVREAHEEVGAVLLAKPWLLGIYTNFYEGKNDHVALFVSENFRLDEATDRWEIEEVRRVPLAKLEDSGTPVLRRRVQEYRAGVRGLAETW